MERKRRKWKGRREKKRAEGKKRKKERKGKERKKLIQISISVAKKVTHRTDGKWLVGGWVQLL